MKKIIVTVIGGGTGTMPVLAGLKKFRRIDLRVIVNMTDDGGSNKVVRDEFGILPLSDIRKSIVALSNREGDILRELFTYRFALGDGLSGHTLGNLMMLALTDITKSEYETIRIMSDLFKVKGQIIPVTYDKTCLCARYQNGVILEGESSISGRKNQNNSRIENLYLCPEVVANDAAIKSINQSDFIIIGPGDLYSSILSNIVVNGIRKAMQETKASIIYISNLMTQKGETRGMQASDLITEVEKYLGKKIDFVILNKAKIKMNILKQYAKSGESPIKDNLANDSLYTIIRANIISNQEVKKEPGDKLPRSILRHDKVKLGKVLNQIFKGQ
ncbi:MAG: gluconeogenesis factor YvcK family protein [bacterium]